MRLTIACAALLALTASGNAATIQVPADLATVQEAIDTAVDGDTVLVAPGVYHTQAVLADKNITLASWHLVSADTSHISGTVLEGDGATILTVSGTDTGTLITGLHFHGGDDGLSPSSPLTVVANRFTGCIDGIDYEGGGGICRGNVFAFNLDDGVDLDLAVSGVFENNTIVDNVDDGIEIRLHSYSGPELLVEIRGNRIERNGEDGIQIIDYPGLSDRRFLIERNLILNNAMAGLAFMADGETMETYEAASVPEPVELLHNVFDGHVIGVCGGDSLRCEGNVIMNASLLGGKGVDGGSVVACSLFWGNGTDSEGCNLDAATLVYAEPRLDATYRPAEGSPCIDAGCPECLDPDGTICDIGAFFMPGTPVDPDGRRSWGALKRMY